LGSRPVPRLQRRESPKDEVHPIALELLKQLHFPIEGLRSKAWDEFAGPVQRRSTSYSPSVTTRPARSVQYGPGKPVTAHSALRAGF